MFIQLENGKLYDVPEGGSIKLSDGETITIVKGEPSQGKELTLKQFMKATEKAQAELEAQQDKRNVVRVKAYSKFLADRKAVFKKLGLSEKEATLI